MGNNITKPRGTQDLYDSTASSYQNIINTLDEVATNYGAVPFFVPMFEEGKLFKRGVGESTDIVTKETFDLVSKGGHEYTLRPEFTAGITRAVIENKLYSTPDLPLKYFYSGSAFRYERPQAGRYRELHQWGVEILDIDLDIHATAEALLMMFDAAKKLGISPRLIVNYIGSNDSRSAYKQALIEYFTPLIDSMCADCKARLELNPLRILDCKVQEDRRYIDSAPTITSYLTKEDQRDYQLLLDILDANMIPYTKDERLVRGLDYYTGVVFEIYEKDHLELGALGGGGRYDGLMKTLGGPEFKGVGFAFGVDRLLLTIGANAKRRPTDLMILLEDGDLTLDRLKWSLQKDGFKVISPTLGKTLSGALKMADRLDTNFILFKNEDGYQLKDLKKREQKSLGSSDLEKEVRYFLRNI